MTRARFHVELATVDGDTLESTYAGEPMDIELGQGEVHACIERLVENMAAGDSVNRRLGPTEAFGVPEADRCVTLARTSFDASLPLEAGAVVEFDVDGEPVAGTIVALDTQSVRVDMNHPLAGHELDVRIELLALTP